MASILGIDTIQNTVGTTAASIDNAGRMTQPNIPFIMCNCNNSSTNTVAPSSFTGRIPLHNIFSSRGITLDTSTNLWSVPVTGLYHISAAVRINSNLSYLYWTIDDMTDSGNPAMVQGSKLVLAHGENSSFTTASGSLALNLQTGKSYQLRAGANDGSSQVLNREQTWMDAYLIG